MRIAVAGSAEGDATAALGVLHRAGLFVGDTQSGAGADPEVRDLHRSAVERPAPDVHGPALPVFVGDDVWFRMRHLARVRDLEHEHWGFTDPELPLLLGVWKYVVPDLRVLVTYRESDAGERSWLSHHRVLAAFVRAHPDDCLVVPMGSVGAGFSMVAEVNRRFGSSLDESVALTAAHGGPAPGELPTVLDESDPEAREPRAMETELLQHEVRHLRARLAAAEEATRAARRAANKPAAKARATASDGVGLTRDDLTWLLDRAARSTAIFAAGDRRRLRELRRRHLGEDSS